MRLLGFEITRSKAQPPGTEVVPHDRGTWWYRAGPMVHEPFTGAWQRNMSVRGDSLLVYSAVYACVTLIASDISKIGLRLVEQVGDIWRETQSAAFSPVLRKPNRYQTRIKFIENWVTSKLINGNTYVLKERDARGVVIALYVLDPLRVRPLVAPDGDVFYELSADRLAGVEEQVAVPSSEIIHDTMVCLYHPLCGVSPLTACALAALQGMAIQTQSTKFFNNGSQPGGILTAPGPISNDNAKRLKDYWEVNYTGEHAIGKIAVLGDGLKFESMAVKAVDAQLIEQLKWSSETVCSVFHVPPHMIGVGDMPAYNNIEALNQQYYSQCLQVLIEGIELLLDEGLGLTAITGKTYGTEFDLNDLLRMDTATKVKSWSDLVKGAIASPNEARAAFNLPPVKGGKSPLAQQQNYSLEALAKRDAKDDPFATAPPPAPPAKDDEEPADDEAKPADDETIADEKLLAFAAMLDTALHEGLSHE